MGAAREAGRGDAQARGGDNATASGRFAEPHESPGGGHFAPAAGEHLVPAGTAAKFVARSARRIWRRWRKRRRWRQQL